MLEEEIASERRLATRVRDGLHLLTGKLLRHQTATPSELSARLQPSGRKVSSLFLWMSCTAVGGKYRSAGKTDIAVMLASLATACEREWGSNLNWSERNQLFHPPARQLQGLRSGTKRISQRQSRVKCADLDIILCSSAAFSIEIGITPWVCQQPDLRYRWTDTGMKRLGYLADCWDAYAGKELTWADRTIGLSEFPSHPELC